MNPKRLLTNFLPKLLFTMLLASAPAAMYSQIATSAATASSYQPFASPVRLTTTSTGTAVCDYPSITGALGNPSNTFCVPGAVAVDPVSGNKYVADYGNGRIVKIVTATGATSYFTYTVPGGGTLTSSPAQCIANASNYTTGKPGPDGVAVDKNGNLYIADADNNEILQIAATALTNPSSTTPLTPKVIASQSQVCYPLGLTVDSNFNVYIADTYDQVVTKLVPATTGSVPTYTTAPQALTPVVTSVYPTAVAVDGKGNVYFASADTNFSNVYVASTTPFVAPPAPKTAIVNLASPYGLAIANGTLYVTDSLTDQLWFVPLSSIPTASSTAAPLTSLQGITVVAGIAGPDGIAVDSVGNVFVTTGNDLTDNGSLGGNFVSSLVEVPAIQVVGSPTPLAMNTTLAAGAVPPQLTGSTLNLSTIFKAGTPLSFSTTGASCGSLSGTVLTLSKTAGTCTVKATLANGTYVAAPFTVSATPATANLTYTLQQGQTKSGIPVTTANLKANSASGDLGLNGTPCNNVSANCGYALAGGTLGYQFVGDTSLTLSAPTSVFAGVQEFLLPGNYLVPITLTSKSTPSTTSAAGILNLTISPLTTVNPVSVTIPQGGSNTGIAISGMNLDSVANGTYLGLGGTPCLNQPVVCTYTLVDPSMDNDADGIIGFAYSNNNATLAISIPANADAETYSIPITVGAGSTAVSVGTLTLTVSKGAPTYSGVSTSALNLVQGGATGTIKLTGTFLNNASLSLSGLPTGVTATQSTSSDGTSTTFTLTASATATVVSGKTITINNGSTATGQSFLLTVLPGTPTFGSVSPSTVSLAQGTTSGTITLNGTLLNNAGTLSLSGLPGGVTASAITVNSTGTAATFTLTASSTAATASGANVTIKGNATTQTSSFKVVVTKPVPTFGSVSPATVSLTIFGSSSTVTLTGTYLNNATLTLSGVPSGVTASAFTVNSAGTSATVTLTSKAGAKISTSTVTILNGGASTGKTLTVSVVF